jgi:hypothetical protein
MRNVYTKVVEKTKAHILRSVTCLQKSCRLWGNVEKFGGAREAINGYTIWRMHFAYYIIKATHSHAHARARAPLHSPLHTHTIKIRNTYCFSTATIVSQTRLSDTLYVAPLVGCPRLLIQHIRSCPSYLGAASPFTTWGRAMAWRQGCTHRCDRDPLITVTGTHLPLWLGPAYHCDWNEDPLITVTGIHIAVTGVHLSLWLGPTYHGFMHNKASFLEHSC